ncbi:CBS domain-containing protein [Candidatus Woesearchaeota archaeon]|nr:CBS domain-containing protein [Candidatus Woesearchaeota archaeon]
MEELKQIKLLRKKLGLTQSELAIRANVSQSLIAKIESNKIDPSYNNAKKILETLTQLESKKDLTAKEIMNSRIISVSPDDSIKSAISKMKKFDISQLPVLDGNHAVGYVSESIIIDNLLNESKDNLIKNIMEDSPPIVPLDTSKTIIASLLKQFPLVLVKEKENLKGIITKADLLKVLYK